MKDWNNGVSSNGNPTWENTPDDSVEGCYVEEKEDGFHAGLLGNPTTEGPFEGLFDAMEAALDLIGASRD